MPREVFVTIGPIGAGKTTFCEKIIAAHPEIIIVSRDKILIELFGKVWLDRYTGGHEIGLQRMWGVVEQNLITENVTMILDCWNGFTYERRAITRKLRGIGVDQIIGWHFQVSEEQCALWRAAKGDGSHGLNRQAYVNDYRLFTRMPVELEQGFDHIIQIDPLNPAHLDLALAKQGQAEPVAH